MEKERGNDADWTFRSEEDSQKPPHEAPRRQNEPITWTGSEFVAQSKDFAWYFGLVIAIVVCCLVVFLVSHRDVLSVTFIAVMGVLFGIIASRQPRQLSYKIDDRGVTIGSKEYPYSTFKSFSLLRDGAIGYVNLLPLHRFKPEISVYFAPEDEQRILDTLASYLPQEQRPEHPFDRFMKMIRF